MAVVETMNIDGAIVRIHDDYIRSREESEEIMKRVTGIFLRQLNAQHNAKRMQEALRKEVDRMNYDAVTIQDCITLFELKGKAVIIENGHITGFT